MKSRKIKIAFFNLSLLPKTFYRVGLTFSFLLLFLLQVSAQGIRVTGQVLDETAAPLAGVSVAVKGSTTGTTTDAEGNFAITVPNNNSVLVFSYVGYTLQEIRVGTQTNITVALMSSAATSLSEVVVIGYGTAAKRDLTGSIVKIDGKEVADRPNTNPVASLQGKVAGLSVVNSGTPGQEPDIRIRGTVSVNAVKPLYVVDGIFQDNIDYLNPNDIESLEILKDPSSLAIFGIRGATGVIAITTKRAKAGQVLVNFNTNFGAKRLTDKIAMVDAAGFRELFQEEEENIGVPLNERFDFSKWNGNTDWVDAMTRTGIFNNNNISVTASTEKNRFYIGLGYTKEQGIIKREELEKLTLSLNDDFKVSNFLRIGFAVNGLRQKLPFNQANGLLYDARRVLPITPAFNDANNVYTELAIQSAQIGNPLMNLENKWDKQLRTEYRLLGNVFAELSFLRNFTFRSTFYADRSNLDERIYNPIINTYNVALDSVYVDRNNRRTSVNQNDLQWNKYQQDHILTYKRSFSDHNVNATAGFTTFYNDFRGVFASVRQKEDGDPIPDDPRFWYISSGFGDQSTMRSTSDQWERSTASGLVRLLYNYQNKYYLNGSFRRDGSSQISPDNRWKNFYSVGAAWEISKEGFMRDQQTFDFVKLKASLGRLGVQNTGGYNYPFYPSLRSGNTAVFGNVIAPAYSLAYQPDPTLTWETVDAQEVGVELSAFNNRLFFEAAYYNKITTDLMIQENLGAGAGIRLGNIGKIKNHGLELQATWSQSLSNDFSFSVSGNFTTFNNNVVTLPEGSIQYPSEERPNKTEQGYPIGYFYGYVVEGLYQSYADKLNSPKVVGYEYGPGDFKYRDINGDGVIDDKDRTMIGNPTPDFSYGASLSFNYRGLDLGIDLNGVYGNEVYRFWGSSELPFTTFNYPAFKLNRWTGEGTSNWDPILGANHTINRLPSTYGIEDGSYFRIRNLQIGYNFRTSLVNRAHMKSVRIFANVQNLKTFKNNSGYTPEFGGNATSFGIDNGNGPLPVIYTGGLNITF
jgi:TonB-linked SusC/RagA family outer membrane protein